MALTLDPTNMSASETFGTTSAVTGSAPTAVDGTDGQPVQGFDAVTLIASCPSGGTFTGVGNFDCYVLFPSIAATPRWARCKEGDHAATLASGFRDYVFPALDILGRAKGVYLKWVPNAVAFAGGGSTGVVTKQQGSPASNGNRKVFG